MGNFFVSVVIPNFNYGHFLPQTIDSVLSQTYTNFEVVVVNNGSTDHSLDVLKDYANKYPDKVRFIDQENRGQAGARNRGIAESRGEFVAFLDADDVWLPSKLEKQINFFQDPKIGIVYCGYFIADRDLNRKSAKIPQYKGDVLELFARQAGAVISGGESTCIVRKAAFAKAGVFDPAMTISTGWDMYRRIANHYTVDFVPEALVLYRQHGSNAHARIDVMEHDVEIRLQKMFADPNSSRIHYLRRQSYSISYLALSGSYLYALQLVQSIRCALKSILYSPAAISYILGVPFRATRRLFAVKNNP
jgi:glycosyltransferase involved in cell wall biosynthesis